LAKPNYQFKKRQKELEKKELTLPPFFSQEKLLPSVKGDHHIFTKAGVMDKKYEIVIFWSSEDNAFVAEVPELPGCMADGKTYQEALRNAGQIIDEWIETATKLGRAIPQPKGRLAYA
jgi:predicted RNase H-like HicB family nuclease